MERSLKLCGKCGQEKAPNGNCRPCNAAASRAYRQRNPNAASAKARPEYHSAWLKANAARVKEYVAGYWQRTKAERQAGDYARLVEWRKVNVERQRAINARYGATEKGKATKLRRFHRMRANESEGTTADMRAVLAATHCVYCLKPVTRPELDHVVPVSRGGADAPRNWAAACKSCNSSKGPRDPIAWSLKKFGRLVGPIALLRTSADPCTVIEWDVP